MLKIKNNLYGWCALATLICSQATPATARPLDPLIEGAKLCTRHLQHYETKYGIPAHLLSAIASTESGRYHKGLQIKLPWPWTINAKGKGYYFDTKKEAITAAKELYASGIRSMDIGCMQVNLYHHPNAFKSLSQAFEPEKNVAYAAVFLRNLYKAENSWKKAASHYHSKTPKLGTKYIKRVYNSWFKIVDKLRSARLNIPNSSVNALKETKNTTLKTHTKIKSSTSKYIRASKKNNKKSSSYKSPRIKTIKVSYKKIPTKKSMSRIRDNGLIIIRPEITVADNDIKVTTDNNITVSNKKPTQQQPTIITNSNQVNVQKKLANTEPSAGKNTTTALPTANAKIIRLNNNLVSKRSINTKTIKKSGPNFIFNN